MSGLWLSAIHCVQCHVIFESSFCKFLNWVGTNHPFFFLKRLLVAKHYLEIARCTPNEISAWSCEKPCKPDVVGCIWCFSSSCIFCSLLLLWEKVESRKMGFNTISTNILLRLAVHTFPMLNIFHRRRSDMTGLNLSAVWVSCKIYRYCKVISLYLALRHYIKGF